MNKEIKVLCDPQTFIGIGDQTIPVGQLTLEQAELVAAQHPGRYVAIITKKTGASTNAPESETATK